MPAWRPISRVLVWDDAGPGTSIADIITQSIPEAAVDVAADAGDLLRRCTAVPPDIVFVAVRARGEPGLTAIGRLHQQCPGTAIVACGTRADGPAIGAAIGVGARGFALLEPGGVASAVDHSPIGARPRTFAGQPSAALAVTERELQILRGMTDGYSNLEIAKQLFVSEDTVKTHARRLFRKLGANDRAHAVALGMRYELVA